MYKPRNLPFFCGKCETQKTGNDFHKGHLWCKECRRKEGAEFRLRHPRVSTLKIVPYTDLPGEEWRPVPGYEGHYEASSAGRVRSRKTFGVTYDGRVLSIAAPKGKYRYPGVTLSRDGKVKRFSLHTVIALTFLGPCPKGKEVNHIDGVKTNPAASNLEYLTHKHNSQHASRTGLFPTGQDCYLGILTDAQVNDIRRRYVPRVVTAPMLAREFGVSKGAISSVVRFKSHKHLLPD